MVRTGKSRSLPGAVHPPKVSLWLEPLQGSGVLTKNKVLISAQSRYDSRDMRDFSPTPSQTEEITFGQRLRRLRRERQWRQAELARRAGVTGWRISRYELGTGSPNAQALVRLAAALGVSADFLLTGRRTAAQVAPEEFAARCEALRQAIPPLEEIVVLLSELIVPRGALPPPDELPQREMRAAPRREAGPTPTRGENDER